MIRHGWSVAVLVSALAGTGVAFAPLNATAEIYGWVDPSGAVTYSNLPPPKDARVIEVIEETPLPTPQSQAAAEAAHQAEMRVLNERVQQLERELQQTRWQAPPPSYPVSAPPSYGPPPGYAPTASYGPGCDPEFFDCDSWEGPIYYTTGLVPYWGFRHHRDHDHGSHHFPHPGGGGPHFVGNGTRGPGHGSGGLSAPMAHAR